MNTHALTTFGLALLTTACVAETVDYDQSELALARQALPTRAKLEASNASATTATLLGQPAVYPSQTRGLVLGINGAVGATVDLLGFITSLPPTSYNSATSEFFWGPVEDDNYGYVAAYIKDTGESGDFRYEYAFLRGPSQDIATLIPIVYGGATPDPSNENRGEGVAVWDMSAGDTLAQTLDPSYDSVAKHDTGRFAAAFFAGEDEENPGTELAVVVAVFRDFVSKDSDDSAPIDLDYFYGHGEVAGGSNWDFVDVEVGIDVTEPKDGLVENIGVRMVFLDEGTGRAEADAIGGSLASSQSFDVVECWDTSLNQTFIESNISEDGISTELNMLGTSSDCGFFSETLDSLGVPRLEDVDPELIGALDQLASNGL